MEIGAMIIGLIIVIAMFVLWAEAMYYFAGKDKALIFGIIYGVIVGIPSLSLLWYLLNSTDLWLIFGGILLFGFITYVGMTVFEQAGKRERRWYYLTLLFPILALVYQFTRE